VDVLEGADSLQFYDNLVLDKKIEPMFTDLMILVEKSYRLLANKLNPAQRKLHSQSLLIDGFEEAWPKFAMNSDCRCDDALGGFTIPQILSYLPAFLIHF
jgi:hypothetical protein